MQFVQTHDEGIGYAENHRCTLPPHWCGVKFHHDFPNFQLVYAEDIC